MRKNWIMKANRLYSLLLIVLLLSSCAPVLSRTYLREGQREVSFEDLRENPGQYRGLLYILGGIIVNTKFTKSGSQIEAVHVPVDSRGYFKERGRSEGRFLALLPGYKRTLDPAVFRQGGRVTLAGVFIEPRKGTIDEMEYEYPVFEIKQVYLWPKEYVAPPYYYDPWFYPYPYFYWEPWWSPYYYSAPVPSPYIRRSHPPYIRRSPLPAQPLPPSTRPRKENEPEYERR